MCRDRERRGCGFADVDIQGSSGSRDPIKPKVVRVVCPNNSLVTFLLTTLSTCNVFDQQLHLRMLHGASNLSARRLIPSPHE